MTNFAIGATVGMLFGILCIHYDAFQDGKILFFSPHGWVEFKAIP